VAADTSERGLCGREGPTRQAVIDQGLPDAP
jgi:hypothetical protein